MMENSFKIIFIRQIIVYLFSLLLASLFTYYILFIYINKYVFYLLICLFLFKKKELNHKIQ